jgi:hypothetical protein
VGGVVLGTGGGGYVGVAVEVRWWGRGGAGEVWWHLFFIIYFLVLEFVNVLFLAWGFFESVCIL